MDTARGEDMSIVETQQQPLLIGGEWRDAAGGATFERTDPFTGAAVTVAAAAAREDAVAACDAAAAAFPEWSRTSPGDRRVLLTKAADLMMERGPQIAAIMTDVVDALIAHPAVRRVNFTGSTRVGRIVAMKCAENLKRCVLELGGKAPQVVLADADLDAAADAASFGAFMNSGQICMSTERVVV